MDLIAKLNSLLSPASNPANHSQRAASAAAGQKQATAFQSFAQTLAGLADPAILPFGVQPQGGAVPAPATGPTITPSGNEIVLTEPAGPTILPEIPIADPTEPGTRGTLEEVISGGPPPKAENPAAPVTESGPALAPIAAAPGAPRAPGAPAKPSKVASAPPIGVQWATMQLRGSGVEAPGIGGTDAHVAEQLQAKFRYYSDPAAHGHVLNLEGRLFQDAVSRGYVPNTPQGLGTMLAYLGMGSGATGSGGRPAEMSFYFNSFVLAQAAAARA